MLRLLSFVMMFFLSATAQPGRIGRQFSGFVHPIATGTFPVEDTPVHQQPAEEDLTSPLLPAKPTFQVPVTLPIMIERPTGAKPDSFLKPIIVDEQDETATIRQITDAVEHKLNEEDSTLLLAPVKPMHQIAVTLPIMVERPFTGLPSSFLRPIIVDEDEALPVRQKPAEEDLSSPLAPAKPVHQTAVTLPIMVERPSAGIPSSFLRPIIVDEEEAVPVRKIVGQQKPAEEDLTSPLAPLKPMHQTAVTLPIMLDRPSGEKPASFLRPIIVDEQDQHLQKNTGQHKPAEEDLTSPLAPVKPACQTAVTLPIMVEKLSGGIPASYLRPIIVDEQQAPVQKATQQKPAEEDLSSPSEPTKPMFQIPVTIPIMAEPPPNAKPPSFLRPIFTDGQDGPVPTLSQVPAQMPAGQQQPAEEDLTSPLGVAVTLPFLLTPQKPVSWLRPWLVESGPAAAVPGEQQSVGETKPFAEGNNVAATLPFALQSPTDGGIRKSKPPTYLRPIAVWTTDAAASEASATPVRQQTKLATATIPAQQDLTSSISGTVQASPNVAAVALPFYLKPSSYLRPWFLDDSDSKPQGVAVNIPYIFQADEEQTTAARPQQTLLPFFVGNRFSDAATDIQPAGVVQVRPLIATLLQEERPSSATGQKRPLTAMKPLRPMVVQDYHQAVVQPIKQSKPWFVPVDRLGSIMAVEDAPVPQYHLVKPLIALPAQVYPQNQQKPYYFLTSLDV